MPLFGHSQPASYPYQSRIGKDTVAVLHIKQIRYLNVYFLELDKCQEVRDSLLSIVYDFHALSTSQKATITSLEKQTQTLKDIISINGQVLSSTEKELKAVKRKKTFILIAAGVVGSVILLK